MSYTFRERVITRYLHPSPKYDTGYSKRRMELTLPFEMKYCLPASRELRTRDLGTRVNCV